MGLGVGRDEKGGKRVVVMWVEDEGVEVGLLLCCLIMREVNKTVWREGFVIFRTSTYLSKMRWSECSMHELD